MGAALSSGYSSLVSVIESFCRESYSWIVSSCFAMSDKENSANNNRNSDEETGLVEEKKAYLGDVWVDDRVVEGFKNGEIRSIDPPEDRPSQRLRVTFTNDSATHQVILCWISPEGDLHHYYRIPPNGGIHDEHTMTGDAFVLFQALTSAGDDEEEGGTKPVCDMDTVIAAYRPMSVATSGHHSVRIGETESTVTSLVGFLRGTVKKQKLSRWTMAVLPEKEGPKPVPIDTRRKFYETRKYGDWTIYCEPGCWDPSITGETNNGTLSVHDAFQADLKAMSQRLPVHVRRVLCESTVLYMNTTHVYGEQVDNPVACFHHGREWLEDHQMNPDKCGHVEIYNVSNYAKDRRLWGTGGIVLHEFCHAYHWKHLPDGYENREIIECYQAAMADGLYDHCNYHACCVAQDDPFADDDAEQCSPQYQIQTAKHYACSNPMEFFAELSVAFLASPEDGLPQEEYNKWFPHNAKQLKEHDPRTFALLQKLWGEEKPEKQ